MVETDEVKPAPAQQEEANSSHYDSNATKPHQPPPTEGRAWGETEQGEGDECSTGFLTCSFANDDDWQQQGEQQHVVDMECEERQSDVEEDVKDNDDDDEERLWIQQYEAVSTRGRTHTVGLRELRGDDDELRRLVTLDHQVFGAGSWNLKCFKRYVRRMRGAGFVAVIDVRQIFSLTLAAHPHITKNAWNTHM
jgi:hypothetical protein